MVRQAHHERILSLSKDACSAVTRGISEQALMATLMADGSWQMTNGLWLRPSLQPSKPIIVKIIEPPPKSELSGLADVLIGSLGLTGVITIAAILLGAVMAAVMFWIRSRST